MTDMNIYQRINAVMRDVDYVKKDAAVSAGGPSYKAVTHDAVVGLVRKAMVEHGIVVRPRQTKGKVIQYRAPKDDIKQHFYSAWYDIDFVNIDKPDEVHTATVNAHAMDTQDKAPGKAMSYAVKYAMLKTFSIETGENEESRYAEAPAYTQAMVDRFHELLEEGNGLQFLAFMTEIGDEASAALQGTFESGKISAGKKRVKELHQAGWDVVHDYATQIKERISDNDPSVLELTGELVGTERRLVADQLSESETEHLRKLKNLGV